MSDNLKHQKFPIKKSDLANEPETLKFSSSDGLITLWRFEFNLDKENVTFKGNLTLDYKKER